MNDPHVVALIYRVEHGDSADYSQAQPLVLEEPTFRLEVKDKEARFELKDPYATATGARKAIEPYIRNWEFNTCLDRQPDSFRLKFVGAEITDRNPLPSAAVRLAGSGSAGVGGSARLTTGKSRYPSPPSDVSLSPAAQKMYQRYIDYHRGREKLTEMAYFCLTIIENSAKHPVVANKSKQKTPDKRQLAAAKYNIEVGVLKEIGRLSSTKGGPTEARKEEGSDPALTLKLEERHFLEQAVKKMIRRMAEKAHDPKKNLPEISLSDLPKI